MSVIPVALRRRGFVTPHPLVSCLVLRISSLFFPFFLYLLFFRFPHIFLFFFSPVFFYFFLCFVLTYFSFLFLCPCFVFLFYVFFLFFSLFLYAFSHLLSFLFLFIFPRISASSFRIFLFFSFSLFFSDSFFTSHQSEFQPRGPVHVNGVVHRPLGHLGWPTEVFDVAPMLSWGSFHH